MQQLPPRNTPRKGRPRRDSTQAPRTVKPTKNYASENDIPRDSTGIHTPRKSTPGAAHNHNNSNFRSNSGTRPQRSRYRGRPASIATNGSPASYRQQDRNSPPLTANKTTAYAGATYHSTPAPSSLPIPSFMLNTLDSPSNRTSVTISQEPSPPASDSESLSTLPSTLHTEHEQDPIHESPLDFFFKKHREEKKRSGRSNSAQGLVTTTSNPFGRIDQSPSGWVSHGLCQNGAPNTAPRLSFARNTTTGISPEDLNRPSGRPPVGPAFSRPFKERIKAARNGMTAQASPTSAEPTPTDGTQALKALLNIDVPFRGGNCPTGPSSFVRQPNPFAPGLCESGQPVQAIPPPIAQSAIPFGSQGDVDAAKMTNNLKNLLKIQ